MTSITATADALLERIHEAGYWRVQVHPSVFEKQRIPTLKECEELIEATRVRLRGWDYPHIERTPNGITRGDDWIQSSVSFGNHLELWRVYQSGQFVHHVALQEDRTPLNPFDRERASGQLLKSPRFVTFLEVLYTLTEVLEFTRGLSYRGVLDPVAAIQIEMHDTEGRKLAGAPGRPLLNGYTAQIDPIQWSCDEPAAAIVADAARFAIDATLYFFERFNWLDASRPMLEEDQRRLLERRL